MDSSNGTFGKNRAQTYTPRAIAAAATDTDRDTDTDNDHGHDHGHDHDHNHDHDHGHDHGHDQMNAARMPLFRSPPPINRLRFLAARPRRSYHTDTARRLSFSSTD
jgi:G3E family GTPase